jgi:protein-disulfide isomerase
MNRRLLVLSVAALALMGFVGAGAIYTRQSSSTINPGTSSDVLVRPHSPVLGAEEARVTIVEFFDPSCEACRAYYPFVKRLLAQQPTDLRLVIRYTPFHEGSDEAVRILETARLQGVFQQVLEALVDSQPQWAIHGAPRLDRAWSFAEAAGLDVARARADMNAPSITQALEMDVADVKTLGIRATPTFFINGRELRDLNPEALFEAVQRELESIT